MGQAASKASKATEAAKRAAAPHISQTIKTNQTRAAAEAEWNRFTAEAAAASTSKNHSVGEYSPTRGMTTGGGAGGDDDDAPTNMPEMPPDLIQFLNDAGPLQRTVDKDLTSSKVYDALVSDENAREEQAKQANLRVRRKMPIVSHAGHDAEQQPLLHDVNKNSDNIMNDGTMTERTTNFSTRDRSSEHSKRLGITREELFQLSKRVRGMEVDSNEWKGFIESEYGRIANGNDGASLSSTSGKQEMPKKKNFDQLQDMILFENSLKYIGVPELMVDADGDLIGTWHHRADEMKHSSGLKIVPEGSAVFIMESEGSAVSKES